MGIEFLKDEIDKKIAGGVFDPLKVENKDPAYHYRWLRKEKLNMTRKTDFMGYETVKAGGQEKSYASENTPLKGGDTTERLIEVGDLVLARIPKELHEEYRRRNKAKIDALATGVSASFKSAVGGGRAFEEHRDVAGYSGSVSREDVDLEEGT
jgi:hypothetical protein